MNNLMTGRTSLDDLAAEIASGRNPTFAEMVAFQEAEHEFADDVLKLWQMCDEEQQQHGGPTAAPGGTPPTTATAQAPSPPQQVTGAAKTHRTPRAPERPCPALPELRLAQVAFFDNGPQKASKKPGGGRKNAKPQFMTAIQAYTRDPQDPEFDLCKPTWSKNVLMFRHREMAKKFKDWTTPRADGSTSISQPFYDRLADWHGATDTDGMRDRVMFGLFMHTDGGRGFHDHQFVMIEFEHGQVNSGALFLDEGNPIRLVFDVLTSKKTALGENIRGQARFDPQRNYFLDGWATCWL